MCITVMNSSLYKIVHNSIVRKNSSPCVMNSSPCVMKFVRRFYTVFSTNDEFITSSHAWWIHHHSSLFNTTVFNSSHTWWIHHTHDDIITGLEDLTQKPFFLCITGPCWTVTYLYRYSYVQLFPPRHASVLECTGTTYGTVLEYSKIGTLKTYIL